MRNFQKESLFQLIKSLSKSEKRQFKLYANRLQSNSDTKFIALFNLLDKMNVYDEQKILHSKIVKREQLSNVKESFVQADFNQFEIIGFNKKQETAIARTT
ncbi:MAG: hypothetical protein ACPGHV_04555 [Flavobacteriaceae bacterium]